MLLLFTSQSARAQQASVTITDAAWLAGCWVMHRGETTIEEQWMGPGAGQQQVLFPYRRVDCPGTRARRAR
jgi:hypothetical protein